MTDKQIFRGNEDPFVSEDAAVRYARSAGFSCNGGPGAWIASRSDMKTVFTLTQQGEYEYRWHRPFGPVG